MRPSWRSLSLLLLPLGACVAPRRHVDEWTDLRVTQKVDVWTQGQHWRLYGVTVLLDSITGIPADMSLDCDACRVGFPRSQIDSAVTRRINGLVEGVALQAGSIVYLMALSAIPCEPIVYMLALSAIP